MSDQITNIWKASGFVGIKKLKHLLVEHNIQASYKEISEIIKNQKTNQIHKEYKKNQKSLGHIIAYAKNHNWQMDLSDMTMYSNKNHGYKYILLAIDVFTRKAYAQPLKNKTEKSVLEAFNKMSSNEQPIKLTTDNGSEFVNKKFEDMTNNNEINHVKAMVGDHHALGIIDRFTRTLKEMVHKHFTENNTVNWVDNLQTFIKAYNNNPHEGINQIKPENANNEENKNIIIKLNIDKANEQAQQEPLTDLKVGDDVRIRIRGTFRKGYLPRWSSEIYKIHKIFRSTAMLSDGKKYKLSDIQKADVNLTVNFDEPSEYNKNLEEYQKQLNFKKTGLNKINIIEKQKRTRKKPEQFQA